MMILGSVKQQRQQFPPIFAAAAAATACVLFLALGKCHANADSGNGMGEKYAGGRWWGNTRHTVRHQEMPSSFSSSSSSSDSSAENLIPGKIRDAKSIWAVLVAGSNSWWNYRHQADICHAYHILHNHGVPAEQIITMMYDDIANNKQNPYPGQIFNSPAKQDVYAGVAIDYRGKAVTPSNFLAVLTGNSSATKGGNGRVLASNSNDKVFIYFADHGATGILAFPNEEDEVTVKQLSKALREMKTKGLYGQVTFYVEACESGSMFENTLEKELNIYTVTAANSVESSWATYCDVPHLKLPCLGDEFSVNWLEDSDREDLSVETLLRQFQLVKSGTKKSHVSSYGENVTIPTEMVGAFQGDQKTKKKKLTTRDPATLGPYSMWNSRDVPLRELYAKRAALMRESLQSGDGSDESGGSDGGDTYESISHEIHVLEKKRRYLESVVGRIVEAAVHDPNTRSRVLSTYPTPGVLAGILDCHDAVAHAFSRECFSYSKNPYALKYVYVLANLCELGIETTRLTCILEETCAGLDDIQNIQ